MLRVLINIFLLLFGFIINSSLFECIKLQGVKPDLFIIFIVSISVLRSDVEGAIFGFFAGFMCDIFFGRTLGFFALIYMFVGYLSTRPFKYFYRENYLIPMLLCFFATIFFEIVTFALSFSMMENFFYAINKIILPKAIYNTILILGIYPLIYLLNKKLEQREIRNCNFF